MMNVKRGIFLGVIFAAFMLGLVAMKQAMPETKSERIYKAIEPYSPYRFEKNMGGLTIVDIRDGFKEKPNSADVLHRMDELQKKWGAKHLKISGNDLHVIGENNATVAKIHIETPKEREWLKHFYGI